LSVLSEGKAFRWRVKLPDRLLLLYFMLFVVSYVGFLSYASPAATLIVAARNSRFAITEGPATPVPEPRSASPEIARPGKASNPVGPGIQGNEPVTSRARGEVPSAPAPEVQTREADAELATLSAQAVSAGEPEQRAKAIVRLRNLESSPEALAALSGTLANDGVVRNRLLAVAALRSLAARGDPDGSIRVVLKRATEDPDPRVARLALDAVGLLPGVASEPQS
jgi:hypothetical protein